MGITLPILNNLSWKNRERFIMFARGAEIESGEMIALSVTHRNIVVTRGLSRRKQATNIFEFTSIVGF